MKAIMVMFDSLNRHLLPPYGCEWIHAPNFERLAKRAVTFNNCYVGSMPCIPARRELHTGRYNFLHRCWGPLEPFDDSMPDILCNNGVYTHLVTDHQHYFEDGGSTYHNRYSSWELSRGQEGDPWKGHVADPDIPETLSKRAGQPTWRQDWVNRQYMSEENSHPQAKTFAKGLEFIRTNHKQDNWFLQIETFDPHEPFFSHEKYKALYPHEYTGPHYDWPDYERVQQTPEQIAHLQYEYAALLSMCDAHLGKVLDIIDELDLWKDTLLIVNTDHGFMLGEHDWWAKIQMPFFNEIAHTPLFIYDPRSRSQGERRNALVQTIDLAPTLLEYFAVTLPVDMQGIPLGKTLADDSPVHDVVIFGAHGLHVNCTDGRYVYMRSCATQNNTPLCDYTLMATHMRSRFSVEELQDIELAEPFKFTKGCKTLKVTRQGATDLSQTALDYGTMLFDLETDPRQENPITDPEIEQRMIKAMIRLMKETDAPGEQFERLGLLP